LIPIKRKANIVSPFVGRTGIMIASLHGSPTPRHWIPSNKDSGNVPSRTWRVVGSLVRMASLKAGINPSLLRFKSNLEGEAGWPSGTPMEPSKMQDFREIVLSEE